LVGGNFLGFEFTQLGMEKMDGAIEVLLNLDSGGEEMEPAGRRG